MLNGYFRATQLITGGIPLRANDIPGLEGSRAGLQVGQQTGCICVDVRAEWR